MHRSAIQQNDTKLLRGTNASHSQKKHYAGRVAEQLANFIQNLADQILPTLQARKPHVPEVKISGPTSFEISYYFSSLFAGNFHAAHRQFG